MMFLTASTASTVYILLLSVTDSVSALPKPQPQPQLSSGPDNSSPLFENPSSLPAQPAQPPPLSSLSSSRSGTNTYLQNPHSDTGHYESTTSIQGDSPFRNANEVEIELTTAQNSYITERLALNERGYGSLELDANVAQVHHNHDGNRITEARVTRSPINFPTLECFLRVDGLERDRSLLAAWGDASSSSSNSNNGGGGGYGGDAYGGSSSSSNGGNIVARDYHNQGDGSRGRIYRPESESYGYDSNNNNNNNYGGGGGGGPADDSEVREYFEESGQVEQLALTHHYPPLPFELEPSTYYLGSTIHCISQ